MGQELIALACPVTHVWLLLMRDFGPQDGPSAAHLIISVHGASSSILPLWPPLGYTVQ
jgi:hypothetical protein